MIANTHFNSHNHQITYNLLLGRNFKWMTDCSWLRSSFILATLFDFNSLFKNAYNYLYPSKDSLRSCNLSWGPFSLFIVLAKT